MRQVRMIVTVELDDNVEASELEKLAYFEWDKAEGPPYRSWADLEAEVGILVPGENDPPYARIVSVEASDA